MKDVYELSNNLLGVFPCNTYETILDRRNFEERYNGADGNNGIVAYEVDDDAFSRKIEKMCHDLFCGDILESLRKYGVSSFGGFEFKSPSAYNYCGDWVDITVTMCEDWKPIAVDNIKKLMLDDYVVKFMKDNYRSYPGYINLMPSDYRELMDGIRDDDHRAVAAYLQLALVHDRVVIYSRDDDGWTSIYDINYVYCGLSRDTDGMVRRYDIFELARDTDFGKLYADDAAFNEFYHNLGEAIGFPWIGTRIDLYSLGGKFYLFAENMWDDDYTPALRLVHWAIANRYSLGDLMAAIKSGRLDRLADKCY